jgi:CheY-like chemotaxis protein
MDSLRSDDLRGRRLLIVEDEYILAADLAQSLEDVGVEVVGPAGSIEDALALIDAADDLDGAVLDVNVGGERIYPVADMLRARGVPYVFTTGYDEWVVPQSHADVPRCEKPVDPFILRRVLCERMAR